MKIEVTQEDIDRGIPEDPTSCPVARAVRRAFPDAKQIGVDYGEVVVDDNEWIVNAGTAIFIEDFDRGDKVEPFVFELDDPE
jgi:hypothetical protein